MRRNVCAAVVFAVIAGACSAGADPTTTTAAPPTTTTVAPITIVTASGPRVGTIVDELSASTGGVAVAPDGTIYMASMGPAPQRRGTRIYKVSPSGETTLYIDDDRLRGASGNAVDSDGNLYQASLRTGEIFRITPDGEMEPFAEDGLQAPVGVVVNPDGGLFVADCGADAVVSVSALGEATVLTTDPAFDCPNGITIDESGTLFVVNFNNGDVLEVSADGSVTTLASIPGSQGGHLVYADGVLYVVARKAHQIYTVGTDGTIAIFAGTGERGIEDGALASATFSLPNGIAVGPDGSLYVNQVASDTTTNNFPVALRVIEVEP